MKRGGWNHWILIVSCIVASACALDASEVADSDTSVASTNQALTGNTIRVLIIGNSQLGFSDIDPNTPDSPWVGPALQTFSESVNGQAGKLAVTVQNPNGDCNSLKTDPGVSVTSNYEVVIFQPAAYESTADYGCWDYFRTAAQNVGARFGVMSTNQTQSAYYNNQSDIAFNATVRNYAATRSVIYVPAGEMMRQIAGAPAYDDLTPWYFDHAHPSPRAAYGYVVALYQAITGRTSISTPVVLTALGSPSPSNAEMTELQTWANKDTLGEPNAVANSQIVSVFWRHDNGSLDRQRYQSSWSANNLALTSSSRMISDASPVNTSSGVEDVFWKGADNNLWHSWYVNGALNGPGSLGAIGQWGGSPRAVGRTNGNVDVFWRDETNKLKIQSYPSWGAPTSITTSLTGSGMTTDPSPVTSSSNVLDVFWKGTDDALWHAWNTGSGWSIGSLGAGPLGSAPRAVGQSDGKINVFWTGTDNQLWTKYYVPSGSGGTWTGPEHPKPSYTWTSAGKMISAPTVTVSTAGTIEVLWKGADNNLWHQRYESGAWQDPASLGSGPLGSAPVAVGQSNGYIDVFWRGADYRLWKKTFFPGYPNGWSVAAVEQMAGNFIN